MGTEGLELSTFCL